jgi:hypothetical protein
MRLGLNAKAELAKNTPHPHKARKRGLTTDIGLGFIFVVE